MSRPVWLDIARLAERAALGTLTGIDRVELAYAEGLLRQAPDRLRFVMLQRCRARFAEAPRLAAERFLGVLAEAWRAGRPADSRPAALRLLARSVIGPAAPHRERPAYLLVSHRHLHRPAALAGALRHSGAAFVPLIHDVIPLTHPEYARPSEPGRHEVRMKTVAALADAVVANSAATAEALIPFLPATCPVHAAPLGVAPFPGDLAPETADRPYFLCVGTIEPRKNHLLLLHLWRRLAERCGSAAPRLVIAGGRGWENENVLDLLDRCAALRGHVVELGRVPDRRLSALMRGARALLMPSFAEGFGLPVAEALALGVPVLCSDLPALRETGGAVPDYFDPLDAPAWEAAILDYAAAGSARRSAQLVRMAAWQPRPWDAHVADVLAFVTSAAGVAATAAARVDRCGVASVPAAAARVRRGAELTNAGALLNAAP